MKKWTVVVGITLGTMLVGLAAIAAAPFAASAQTLATATNSPGLTATAAPNTANPEWNSGDPQGDLPGLQESDLVISATASITGLTVPEVNTQLQAGQTPAQIAQAKGKTAADVIQAARAALSTGLQSAVTAGTITQAQADAELAEFDQRAQQLVNDTGLNNQPGPGVGDHGYGGPRTEEALVSAAATVTGLTSQDVTTQLQAGQSLEQIATAKGKTAADVITAARAALSTQLQQAVTAGNLTQTQADAELASFDQNAPQIVKDPTLGTHAAHGFGFGRGDRGGPGGLGGPGALINATVSVTGLTQAEVMTQLQAGQTLAQIAQTKGKTADDVIQAARTALTTQLQQAVTAGQLTQAQSDAELAQFNQSATQLVNDATLGQHAGGRGGHHGGPNGSNNSAPAATATSTANS